ncbi:MAG: NTP transferase domain-containing protein [Taibaiella sp.]|nr:NTP transferase domain-containing protein [Taibaiella sp.]
MKAFLLAAGLGTRLRPFTDHHPKALAQVNGKTLLEWNIRTLQKFGIQEFVINVHHFGDQIKDFLMQNEGFGSRYHISEESEELLETGGALLHAREFLSNADHILMMNVDILSNIDLKQFIQFHLIHNRTGTLAVQDRASSRKLLFGLNEQEEYELKAWINTRDGQIKPPSVPALDPEWRAFSFSGIQLLKGSVLDHITHTGKFSIIDAYLDIIDRKKIIAYDHTGDIMIDVGKPESLEEAQKVFTF